MRRRVRRILRDAESVADLGCGTGEHLRTAFPRLKRLFLNDLSPRMLEDCAAAMRAAHDGVEIETHLGGIETLPAGVRACEVAICLGVLNHLEPGPLRDALATLARVAEKTIVLYYAHEAFLLAASVGETFREMGIHYAAIDRAEVAGILERQGCELVRSGYAFALPLLSPLVVQEFRVVANRGRG